MAFLVYNKNTGKYLKKHSGSYRALKRNECYKDYIEEEFGPEPSYSSGPDAYNDYWIKASAFILDKICQAEPNNARQYATEGSAIASVGRYTKSVAPENRKSKKAVYILPDYFELHEIKEICVTVERPRS